MLPEDDNYLDGDLNKDIQNFERYLKGDDLGYMDADRLEALIDHFLISGQYKKSKKCAEYALQIFSFQKIFHVRLAQSLSALGKLKEALNVLSGVDKGFEPDCEIVLTKASIFSQLKDSKLAIKYFKESLELAEDEDKDEIYLDLVMEYENQNDYHSAIKVIKEAIKINPLNEGAIYELAFCYDQLGEYENAIKSYSDFIDENPYSYTSWYNLGNAYSKLENFEKAIWAYDYCLIINEEFGPAHFNLGNAFLSQEKFRQSIDSFQKCMDIDGDDPVALCYIGEAYEQLGELQMAKMFYQQTIDLAPMLPDAWLGMGIVQDLEGKTFEALTFILKALELDPENAGIYHVLAGAYEKLNEKEIADENYIKSLTIDPTDEECLNNYVAMLMDIDLQIALDFCEKFEADFGKNRILPLFQTNIYHQIGRKEEALYYFRFFYELDKETAKELFEYAPNLKTVEAYRQLLDIK